MCVNLCERIIRAILSFFEVWRKLSRENVDAMVEILDHSLRHLLTSPNMPTPL
jgi:hypothetical protein